MRGLGVPTGVSLAGKHQRKRRFTSRPVARSIRPVADAEIKAEIVFAGDETLRVRSTVEQIKKEIEGVTGHLPLIKVVSQEGDEIWLNANHIRAFKVYDPSMPLVGSV